MHPPITTTLAETRRTSRNRVSTAQQNSRCLAVVAKTIAALACILILHPHSVMAQRRGGQATKKKANSLTIIMKTPSLFGKVHIPPGTYRLTTSATGITFTHPRTMLSAATIEASVEELPQGVEPAVRLNTKGDKITIVVSSGNRRFTAKGVKTRARKSKQRVILAGQKQVNLSSMLPQEKTIIELIHEGIERAYVKSVSHCADLAQKSRWRTDDKRYWNCVCPNTTKWRLAKPKTDVRIHHHISPAMYGFSITVTPKGKTKDCRVWVGPTPPSDEPAEAHSKKKLTP